SVKEVNAPPPDVWSVPHDHAPVVALYSSLLVVALEQSGIPRNSSALSLPFTRANLYLALTYELGTSANPVNTVTPPPPIDPMHFSFPAESLAQNPPGLAYTTCVPAAGLEGAPCSLKATGTLNFS